MSTQIDTDIGWKHRVIWWLGFADLKQTWTITRGWKPGLNWEIVSIRLMGKSAGHSFDQWFIWEAQITTGSSDCRQVVSGYIRKQLVMQAVEGKPVCSVPPWPLLQVQLWVPALASLMTDCKTQAKRSLSSLSCFCFLTITKKQTDRQVV